MRFSTAELAAHLGGDRCRSGRHGRRGKHRHQDHPAGTAVCPDRRLTGRARLHSRRPRARAPAYLTAREPDGRTAVVVDDTAAWLMDLGGLARDAMRPGVGITGSVGKTTTKDLLRHCLSPTYEVSASERSFNNELGLPLTLLWRRRARRVVLEMGARAGHVARLAEVARPDVGVVTSVAMAHVAYFGDLEGVARAKSESCMRCPPPGWPSSTSTTPGGRMASSSPAQVLGYSWAGGAEVRAERVVLDAELRPRSSAWSRPGAPATSDSRCTGSSRSPTPWPRPPRRCGAASRSTHGVRAGGGRRVPAPHGGARRARGPRGGGGLLQRQPGFGRGGAADPGRPPGRRHLALLGLMAELGDETEAEHRRIAGLADQLGLEVVGYGPELYGTARQDGVDDAVALLPARAG